jgi:hypothetical protein
MRSMIKIILWIIVGMILVQLPWSGIFEALGYFFLELANR